MDDRLIEDFGVARAPAAGRFRIFALSGDGAKAVMTIGLVDTTRDRSLQITIVPTHKRVLGLRRPALLKLTRAFDGPSNGSDVLHPLRAAGPDLATALVVLRSEPEHVVRVPPDGRHVRLTTSVEGRVLRVDVHDDGFHSPVFLAPADATDHDLLPATWPKKLQDPAPAPGREYARFLPPLWRAAADLIREAGRSS